MQLEEIERQWQRLDRKLDQSIALETELVRRTVLQPAQRRVNRLAFWPALDVAFAIGGLLVGGLYLGQFGRDSWIAAPAIVIMIGFLALLISSIWQLQCVSEIEWSGPVASIQDKLARLRMMKVRQFKWIMLLAPLLGFCGLIVALQWLIGWASNGRFNVFDKLDARWIVANYIFGIVFVPVGYLVARFLAQRCQSAGWWQSMLDGIGGTSLKKAANELERWKSLTEGR